MPEPIEYKSATAATPPYSLSAVLGFALCVGGPPIGLSLFGMLSQSISGRLVSLLALVAPFTTGIALAIMGFIQTGSREPTLRGRSLASVGLIIAVAWLIVSVLVTVAVVGSAGDH